MSFDRFLSVYRRFSKFKKENPDDWNDKIISFLHREVTRKTNRYPKFLERVNSLIQDVENAREAEITKRVLEASTDTVVGLIKEWMNLNIGIPVGNLEINRGAVIGGVEVLLKGVLTLPLDRFKEMDHIMDFTEIIHGSRGGEGYFSAEREFLWDLIDIMILLMNEIIEKESKSKWKIRQVSNIVEITFSSFNVHSIFSFNNYEQLDFPRVYYNGNLGDDLREQVAAGSLETIDAGLLEKIDALKTAMLKSALSLRAKEKHHVYATLEHFRHLCLLLGRMHPMYCLLSYIVSRFDLSEAGTQGLLGKFGKEREFREREFIVHSYLLEFVMEQAILFETFQSNDGLYAILQYYLVDIERDAMANKMLWGEKLYDRIVTACKDMDKLDSQDALFFSEFKDFFLKFLVTQYQIFDMPSYGMFIRAVLDNGLRALFTGFIIAYLKSAHQKLSIVLEKFASRGATFVGLVNFLTDFMKFGLDQTFLLENASEASIAFLDGKHRFSEENNALALLDIVVHREYPVISESKWMVVFHQKYNNLQFKGDLPTTILSLIGDQLLDQSLDATAVTLDEWFFTQFFKPFLEFFKTIRDPLSGGNTERVLETSMEFARTRFDSNLLNPDKMVDLRAIFNVLFS